MPVWSLTTSSSPASKRARRACCSSQYVCPIHSLGADGKTASRRAVVLESPEQIGQHAAKIAETVASGYMPLGNLTGITEEERRLIATWHAQGAATR